MGKGTSSIKFLTDQDLTDDSYSDLLQLSTVVARSISQHYLVPFQSLPAKTKFEWTLGDTVIPLQKTFDADYALFSFFRDNFSSGGRIIMSTATALFFGYAPPAGRQTAYIYLVDLHSGDIVWFNTNAGRDLGDIRDPEIAQNIFKTLLDKFPQWQG